jgi:DNA-binding IscR family transcriptional regulator
VSTTNISLRATPVKPLRVFASLRLCVDPFSALFPSEPCTKVTDSAARILYPTLTTSQEALDKSISCNMMCYMKRDSKLSGVLHLLLHMAESGAPLTSETLARAMRTNPVVVRRILAGLRKRGFVTSEKGHGGGWQLSCDLTTVTLHDIYSALGSPTMLAIGNRTESPNCLVEQAVNTVMKQAFRDAEALLLARFSEVTLAELSHQLQLHRQERRFCRGHDETRRSCVRQRTIQQEEVQRTTTSDEHPDRSA